MREITYENIVTAVAEMCVEACVSLPCDVASAINKAYSAEHDGAAKDALGDIIRNINISVKNGVPLCQDTGLACVFVTLGQEVHVNGSINDAVNEGVRRGYKDGFLRKSVVSDPFERNNTGDNTPAVIYYDVVEGDIFEITVAPKGAGSENMSATAMLTPAQGLEGVRNFVIETVRRADANPCPPVVVGVGIGGNFDRAAVNAKRALLMPLGTESDHKDFADELCEEINALGIGTMGYGGAVSCLGVNIISAPTHIAMLPVAVNMSCHCTRHATRRL